MCSCNYTYVGPALLVLPLFIISLVNLFVAGPPLKTVVLDSSGPSYGASLPFLQLNVDGPQAKFNLYPTDEMTHFFVITCYPSGTATLPSARPLSASGRTLSCCLYYFTFSFCITLAHASMRLTCRVPSQPWTPMSRA